MFFLGANITEMCLSQRNIAQLVSCQETVNLTVVCEEHAWKVKDTVKLLHKVKHTRCTGMH